MALVLNHNLGSERDLAPGEWCVDDGIISVRCPLCGTIERLDPGAPILPDGRIAEHVHSRMWCALHIFIRDGRIEFCGDSR